LRRCIRFSRSTRRCSASTRPPRAAAEVVYHLKLRRCYKGRSSLLRHLRRRRRATNTLRGHFKHPSAGLQRAAAGAAMSCCRHRCYDCPLWLLQTHVGGATNGSRRRYYEPLDGTTRAELQMSAADALIAYCQSCNRSTGELQVVGTEAAKEQRLLMSEAARGRDWSIKRLPRLLLAMCGEAAMEQAAVLPASTAVLHAGVGMLHIRR
jgi:hypothetical protein